MLMKVLIELQWCGVPAPPAWKLITCSLGLQPTEHNLLPSQSRCSCLILGQVKFVLFIVEGGMLKFSLDESYLLWFFLSDYSNLELLFSNLLPLLLKMEKKKSLSSAVRGKLSLEGKSDWNGPALASPFPQVRSLCWSLSVHILLLRESRDL